MKDYKLPSIPEAISDVSSLTLFAKLAVEGTLSGLHRSEQFGSSAEFAEHKLYSPGDDLRRVDWKVFGRNDKFYLKRYDEETNLRAYLVLDASKSMDFKSLPHTKMEYGTVLAASLAYLFTGQHDLVSLLTFGKNEPIYVPPRGRMTHFQQISDLLLQVRPHGDYKVNEAFSYLRERIHKRGMILVLSDFIASMESLRSATRIFGKNQHDIYWIHLLDPAEVEFPYQEWFKFEGLEGEEPIQAHGRSARNRYLNKIDEWIGSLRDLALSQEIHYRFIRTDQPISEALATVFS